MLRPAEDGTGALQPSPCRPQLTMMQGGVDCCMTSLQIQVWCGLLYDVTANTSLVWCVTSTL